MTTEVRSHEKLLVTIYRQFLELWKGETGSQDVSFVLSPAEHTPEMGCGHGPVRLTMCGNLTVNTRIGPFAYSFHDQENIIESMATQVRLLAKDFDCLAEELTRNA